MIDFDADFLTLTTDDISVSACQSLLEEEDGVCTYCLKIENNSDDKIRVLGKDLSLTDEKGNFYAPSEKSFHGEILELNPGEYFEFEDYLPLLGQTAVLYGTCHIIKEQTNKVEDIKIPLLQIFSNQSVPSVLN